MKPDARVIAKEVLPVLRRVPVRNFVQGTY